MGIDWLYWRRGRITAQKEADGGTSAGCMCAVFQLFDSHHLNHHHPFTPFHLQQQLVTSQGVEAPRNSLELEEPPSAMKEEENLNLPVGIQIKTRVSRTEDLSAECSSNSPGAKTPSLVARLMGLDLLPESTSPSLNSKPTKKFHFNQRKERNIAESRSSRCLSDDDICSIGAARSLPETPRISSETRSDVEYRRLSVQINKENVDREFEISAKMMGTRGRRFRQQPQDENTSPGHYAKQIANQVKQNVSRRVGLIDITNRDEEEIRRDQNLVLLNKTLSRLDGEIGPADAKESITQSCSPKLRFLDTKKNKSLTHSGTKSPRTTSTFSDSNQSTLKPKHQVMIQEHEQQKDSKKLASGNASSSLKELTSQHTIRNKKEESFVLPLAKNKAKFTDKKNKKSPLSSEILIKNGPILLPVKKYPSPPATKLPQKQSQVSSDGLSSKRNTQLSSNTSHSYKQPHQISTVPGNVIPDKTNGCATTAAAAAEYNCYIKKILKRAGINDKLTPLTLGKWHTPSHPLDPAIYYYLELFHPTASYSAPSSGVLSRRSNRKLIFQLVDELLAQLLKPHLDFKPWVSLSPINGTGSDHFGLIDEICKKIESFPAANCQVLEDIDSLIDNDLCKWQLSGFIEEEGESLVCEIESEMMEVLVREAVGAVWSVKTAADNVT